MHFLVRHGGGGYTLEHIEQMDMDELSWYVDRLATELKAENDARREQMEKARAKSRSR